MTFHIITIFPKIFSAKGGPASGGDSYGYFSQSIIKRAIEKKLIEIKIHNLRDFAKDKHKTVDDTPYGGGPGMIMKVEPIYKCLEKIKSEIWNFSKVRPFSSSSKALGIPQGQTLKNSLRSNLLEIPQSRILLFSAKGKKYTQADARRLARYKNIILICGRYEGVDERVAKYLADEEISIGDYVLTGGEIPAMVVVDSVARLIPGVLGNPESLTEESFSPVRLRRASADAKFSCEIENFGKICEHPQYTKPAKFRGWKVPEVLLGGDHERIKKWKKKKAKSENLKCKSNS